MTDMRTRPRTIDRTGASAGAVLRGVAPKNQGLRLLVLEEQAPGDGGPVTGEVVILDAGDNPHAPALEPLLFQPADAATILTALRRDGTRAVSVANKNLLAVEPGTAGGAGR